MIDHEKITMRATRPLEAVNAGFLLAVISPFVLVSPMSIGRKDGTGWRWDFWRRPGASRLLRVRVGAEVVLERVAA